MQEKLYFSFFILYTILSQGTLAKFLEESVGESSKLLDRQKRVIDRSSDGETPLVNGNAPYVVNLKKKKHLHCLATILSHHTAITAARCVTSDLWMYSVHSGSSYIFRGNEHNVIEKKMHGHSPSRSPDFLTGIALITVNPPFVFHYETKKIDLHSEPVLAGIEGIVAGWGTYVNYSGRVETAYPKRLRTISVPIMNHRECQNIYRNRFPISEEDICTYHPQKQCGYTDTGAALVIDNKLVGVHIGSIPTSNLECPTKPDVFVFLQHLNYSSWIMRNIIP